MNNKGFAITTILYGILILFCLLLVALLGILSSYRKTQELLIEENHGARDLIMNNRKDAMDTGSLDSNSAKEATNDEFVTKLK